MNNRWTACSLVSVAILAAVARGQDAPDLTANARSDDNDPFPRLLSQTGLFDDLAALKPAAQLIPYELNVPFWSDGAVKRRWIMLPRASAAAVNIGFASTGEWKFPSGTLFVKHFELPVSDADHSINGRRLETRLLRVRAPGDVNGVTYRWRPDRSDAERVDTNLTERVGPGAGQAWYYPGPGDCRTCHTPLNGGVLGVNTRQLNRDVSSGASGGGSPHNQLARWAQLGLFDFPAVDPAHLPKLAKSSDANAPLQDRARSWLDANCGHCHRPGGTVAYFDARYDTPLERQGLIDGPVLIDEGIDRARVIAPGDPWRSIALLRISSLEGLKMPPLAHERVDVAGASLLRAWIQSIPGPPVLAPPLLAPGGSEYPGPVQVVLRHPDPDAEVHFTLDGAAPTQSAPLYTNAIQLRHSATVRARAYKSGWTRSVPAQDSYIILRNGNH